MFGRPAIFNLILVSCQNQGPPLHSCCWQRGYTCLGARNCEQWLVIRDQRKLEAIKVRCETLLRIRQKAPFNSWIITLTGSESPRDKGNGLFCTSITWEITRPCDASQAKRSYFNESCNCFLLFTKALSHDSVHFHGLSFCKRACKGCRMVARLRDIAIVIETLKIRLQFCNIGRTVGLYDYLHFVWQRSKGMLIHPVSKKLKPWLKENALGRIQSDLMIL